MQEEVREGKLDCEMRFQEICRKPSLEPQSMLTLGRQLGRNEPKEGPEIHCTETKYALTE